MVEIKEQGIEEIKAIIAGIDANKHYIVDDLERHGLDNFRSGMVTACKKLGVDIDEC